MVAVGLMIAVVGCESDGCDSSDGSVAKLAETEGDVQSQIGAGESWTPAGIGQRYRIGDAVKTGPKSQAQLTMKGGGTLQLEENSLIRFAKSVDEQAARLDVVTGDAVLESEDEFETTIGLAQLSSKGRVRLSSTPGGLRVDVLVGSATLEDETGKSVAIERDKPMVVAVGGAVFEKATNSEPSVADAGPDVTVDAAAAVEEVATVRITGRNAQMRAPGEKRWKRMRKGENGVPFKTRIRLSKKSRAKLTRGDQVANVSGDAEFVVNGPDEPILTAKRGVVSFSARTNDNVIKVPGGTIVARPAPNGSLGTVAIKRNGQTSITAKRGTVEVKSKSGDEVLTPGESARIGKRGKTVVSVRQPKRADFSVGAGESFVIHDPTGRTALRIRYGDACPDLARVEIAASKKALKKSKTGIEGVGSALVWALRGRSYYRVRCIKDGVVQKKVAKSGSIRVSRDAGTKQLPRRAVNNMLDADGRAYNLAYQNRLPRLTFRWREAPKQALTLVIKPRRGADQRIAVKGAQHTLDSGDLREGSYTWWYETGSGKRSPKTKLSLDFDSSAATAYVKKTPKDSWGSDTVPIEGAALSGWKVQIGGEKVRLDRHSRFNESVPIPSDENAIAIRLSHRRHGVHYYVRRRPK